MTQPRLIVYMACKMITIPDKIPWRFVDPSLPNSRVGFMMLSAFEVKNQDYIIAEEFHLMTDLESFWRIEIDSHDWITKWSDLWLCPTNKQRVIDRVERFVNGTPHDPHS